MVQAQVLQHNPHRLGDFWASLKYLYPEPRSTLDEKKSIQPNRGRPEKDFNWPDNLLHLFQGISLPRNPDLGLAKETVLIGLAQEMMEETRVLQLDLQ